MCVLYIIYTIKPSKITSNRITTTKTKKTTQELEPKMSYQQSLKVPYHVETSEMETAVGEKTATSATNKKFRIQHKQPPKIQTETTAENMIEADQT